MEKHFYFAASLALLMSAASVAPAIAAEIPADAPMATYADMKDISSYGSGNQAYEDYQVAVQFSDPNLVGWKVIGVGVQGASTGFKNYKVWCSTDLKNFDQEADAAFENKIVKGAFETPVTLTAEGLYFGYTMTRDASTSKYPIPVSTPESLNDHALFVNLGGTGWKNWSGYGCATIILYLEGPVKPNSLCLDQVNGLTAGLCNQTLTFPFTVQNYGNNQVSNFEVTYKINGVEHTTSTRVGRTFSTFMTLKQNVNVNFEPIAEPGNYEVEMSITKVNGEPNAWEQEPYKFTITTPTFATVHNPVFEEFTGTGCGYCPRGTLGMAEMSKEVPEYIGAAYHRYNSSDPMYQKSQQPFAADGAPSGMLDRDGVQIDPFYGSNGRAMGIKTAYTLAAAIVAPADMELETAWNDDQTVLKVKSSVKFGYTEPGEKYQFGYILTVDSLSGTTSAWKQSNYYEGGNESNALLKTLCNGEFDLKYFNHVVFDQSAARGIETIESSDITLNEVYSNEHEFTIADNTMLNPDTMEDADPKNIHVIALLLDSEGRIRNGVKATAGTKTAFPVGIQDVIDTNSDAPAVYYDLMGRRVINPQHGLFIRANGSKATKVIL